MKPKSLILFTAALSLIALLVAPGWAAIAQASSPPLTWLSQKPGFFQKPGFYLSNLQLQSGAPMLVSYQGVVKVNNPPDTGTGYFKFAIVDAAGITFFWTNAPMSGGQPGAAVNLSVSHGLFNVLLGDTSLANMAPLGAPVFNGTGRYFRVWFSPNNTTFTQLPDRRIASVPYALQAEEAKTAAVVTDTLTLDGHPAADFWQLTGNAAVDPLSQFLGTTDSQPLVLRTNNTERARLTASGDLGLGTSSPSERLTVDGNALVLGNDNPVARGYTSTNLDYPLSVFVAGRYAYVADYTNDVLAIFDVSDPDNIVAKGYTTVYANSVYVAGRYAYVIGSAGLSIFDISNPENIVFKDSTATNLDSAWSVFVAGHYAYVASSGNDRLAIFDISDPDAIVAKGYTSTNLWGPTSVFVTGRYAYVGDFQNGRLAIFDVSDPDNIVAKDYIDTPLGRVESIYVSGRYAYVASTYSANLVILDISDPDNIVAKDYTDENLDSAFSVFVAGRYAYVASPNNDRLVVFDVSDPDNIVAKGYTSTNLSNPVSVYVAGRYAYVASANNSRLAIFDLNYLESPTLETGALWTGSLQTSDNAILGNDLSVQGGLTVGPGGAQIGGNLGVEEQMCAAGGYVLNITTLTASASLTADQSGVILVNSASAATITLPDASGHTGLTFTIRGLGAGAVTVAAAGGAIDGASSVALSASSDDTITVVSDGTNWYIIADNF